jgi:hypothetical protein
VRGTEPRSVSDYWQLPEPPVDLSVTLSGDTAEIAFTPPSRYMNYRLYREDAEGFSVLVATFEAPVYPVRYTDPVDRLNGAYAYYVVPVHPSLLSDGAPLCGRPSAKRRISVWRASPFSPQN